jgi:hypothetical protein
MTLHPVPSADPRTTTAILDDAAITELRAFNLSCRPVLLYDAARVRS